jgi:hypothetical protein
LCVGVGGVRTHASRPGGAGCAHLNQLGKGRTIKYNNILNIVVGRFGVGIHQFYNNKKIKSRWWSWVIHQHPVQHMVGGEQRWDGGGIFGGICYDSSLVMILTLSEMVPDMLHQNPAECQTTIYCVDFHSRAWSRLSLGKTLTLISNGAIQKSILIL